MYNERLISYYETCSLENIKIALKNLKNFGVLDIDQRVSLALKYQ